MRVRYRRRAKLDIENVCRYIEKSNRRAATEVAARIHSAANQLGAWPHMGHAGSVAKTFEWVVAGLPFVIVYEVDDLSDEVAIIAILHCAQNRP